MLNTVYRLLAPRQFGVAFTDITLDDSHIFVRPTYLSICNADQRYFQGKRSPEVMQEKLPLALIHEAIGRVIYDPTGRFSVGDKVVMIPNIPAEHNNVIAENYLRSSRFRGSSIDGFMQECVVTTEDRLVRIPDNIINDPVASFTEMVSVCYHAISRFDKIANLNRSHIGVWGDGNMGYFTALLLKTKFPQSIVSVFGVVENKLADFSFADNTYLVNDIPQKLTVDHAFEAVGGNTSGSVISQIIEHIQPEGTIALLGVSEEPVPIYTRLVLEKGLRILGTSRSGRVDFEGLLNLYQSKPVVINYLEKMAGSLIKIQSLHDVSEAFEIDIHKLMGKTIMKWDVG